MAGELRLVSLTVCLFVSGSGCLTTSGPTRSAVLSGVESSEEGEAGVDGALAAHLWSGWHRAPLDEWETRLERKFEEACALEQAGLLEDAIEHLGRVQRKNPESAGVLEVRGALYATLGYQRAAAGDFQRAVWLRPGRAETWAALGRMQHELDLNGQALRSLERAGEMGLDTADYHLVVARTYRSLARRGRSADHYAMAIERTDEPSVELYVEAATLATEGGADVLESEALERSLQLVDDALERDPESCQAWFVRGLLLESAGEPTETVAAYLRTLEIDPEHVAAWTNLALFSLRLGDPETCNDAAENALRLETDPHRRRALEQLISKK